MKKIILLLLFVPVLGFSQDDIDKYLNPLAETSYSIAASKPDKKQDFKYYIECKSIDDHSKQAVLIVSKSKVEKFKEYISFLNDTYNKWKKTAEDNNIKDINKAVDFNNTYYESAFSYGDWNFSNYTTLRANFKYIIDKYYIVIFSSKLQSTSNQFMKSEGYMLSFDSDDDFKDLIKKLDENKVIEHFNEKEKKENLFK